MTVWWWASLAWAGIGPAGVVGVLALAAGRCARRRRPRTTDTADVLELAALMAVALSAGMTLVEALGLAGDELGGPPGEDVARLLRRARTAGLALALADTPGPLGELTAHLARAQVTGAPAAAAVEAYLHTRRSDQRTRLLERARTLPIRLIVPVALLLLPGFIALVVGPVVVDQLTALTGDLAAP